MRLLLLGLVLTFSQGCAMLQTECSNSYDCLEPETDDTLEQTTGYTTAYLRQD